MELKEIKNVLRIDEDDTANDEILESLLLAFPKWLSTHSGLSELRQQDNKVVDTLCGLWVRKQYFSYDDVKVDRAIESLVRTVSLMATMAEKEYQDAVFTANGLYRAADYGADAWESVQVSIPEPVTITRTITQNGSYCCSDENSEAVGYSEVIVDVPSPELDTLLVTSSGTYDADSELVYGWDKVVVDVKAEANVGRLDASTAGVYYAKDEGLDGYEVVNVLETVELEPLAITQNGTYEPEEGKGFGSVSVNVSAESGGGSEWEQRYYNLLGRGNASKLYLPDSMNLIIPYMLYGRYEIIGDVIIPDGCATIGDYAFYSCSGLNGVLSFPDSVTKIGINTFNGCRNIPSKLQLPSGLVELGSFCFSSCSSLTGDVEIPLGVTKIPDYAFYQCMNLDNIIIRKTDAVVTLSGINAFSNCKVAKGTAYIYVPDDLVDSYKAATNFSTYAAQIKPLSEYGGSE